jgi:hypothetical protein
MQAFGHTGVRGQTDWGQIDLSDFQNKLKELFPGIERDEVYPKAIRRGAQILANAIEYNTPIRYTDLTRRGEPKTQYNTKHHVKKYHAPGTARRSVIIYNRKGGKSLYQAEVNANVSVLVGYEKTEAYYMYWREVGNRFQPARPVIRPVFDAHIDEALEVAIAYIAQEYDKRLKAA